MIYQHSQDAVRWVLEGHRNDVTYESYKQQLAQSGRDGFLYGSAFPHGAYVQLVVSSDNAEGAFDFAMAMAGVSAYRKQPRVVYVERLHVEPESFLLVELLLGVPERSTVMSAGEIEDELVQYFERDDSFHLVTFGLEALATQREWVIESLSEPLTSTLDVGNAMPFKPVKEVQLGANGGGSKLAAAVAALGIVAVLIYIAWPESPSMSTPVVVSPVPVQNPWNNYQQALTEDATLVHERLLHDYAFHQLFQRGPGAHGWSVDGADISANGQTYRLSASDSASLRAIETFAGSPELRELVGQPLIHTSERAVTLQLRGRNRPLPFARTNQIVDVNDLQYLLADSVSFYIPNSELRFVRDVPSGRFVKRQLELRFRGVYWEDLIGFGAITRDYPVSLHASSGGPVGSYTLSDNRLTGSLFITLIGERND